MLSGEVALIKPSDELCLEPEVNPLCLAVQCSPGSTQSVLMIVNAMRHPQVGHWGGNAIR